MLKLKKNDNIENKLVVCIVNKAKGYKFNVKKLIISTYQYMNREWVGRVD